MGSTQMMSSRSWQVLCSRAGKILFLWRRAWSLTWSHLREEYTLRLALGTDELEAQTSKLFSEAIISFFPPESCRSWDQKQGQLRYIDNDWGSDPNGCVEDRYRMFIILQTLVDHALLWGQNIDPVTGPRNSLLPTSDEELCSAKLVRWFWAEK